MAGFFNPAPFLFGIEGTRASRETINLLRETRACGILLLGRNIETPMQTRGLVSELEQRLGRQLLVSVDHEGGWVLRFSRGLTAFPGNAALGKARDPRLAFRVGRQMARELRALKIGLNLAPVLDVVTERYNPGIIIRSFGRDPRMVGTLGASFIQGLQQNGVAACAKHFPGKGAADVDAHLTLPTISMSRSRHERTHLPPFSAAIKAGVECVMTSHAVFPAWDASRAPATFSRKITGGLLRKRLGFKGVIISDDLCMGAVTETYSAAEAAVKALECGHDLLIVAHGDNLKREAAEAVSSALEDGTLSSSAWGQSCRRLKGLLARRSARPFGSLPKPDPGLAREVARKAVEEIQRGSVCLPLTPGRAGCRSIAVFWPDLHEVRDRFTFEGGPQEPLMRLRRTLSRWPARQIFLKTPLLADRISSRFAQAARRADVSLLFLFEAMRFPGQRKVLEALQARNPKSLVVCLLRNPWDRELLRPSVTALQAYGYRNCQVDALVEALR